MNERILNLLLEDTGEHRLNHTLRVVDEAKKLARYHKVDIDKASKAALLHDCAKFLDKNKLLKMASDFDIILDDIMKASPELIHAPLGAKIAKFKYNIDDKDIINAIRYHTTGRENMSKLEKIIYLADYIEPYRKFIGVENVRQLAYQDLDKSILVAMDQTIGFLVKNNRLISPDTIEARNQLLNNKKGGRLWLK